MTRVIWKFPLPMGGGTIRMPRLAAVLGVLNQREQLVVYARVDPAAPMLLREFEVVQTGETFGPPGPFVGTVAFAGGDYVVHVFEAKATNPKESP